MNSIRIRKLDEAATEMNIIPDFLKIEDGSIVFDKKNIILLEEKMGVEKFKLKGNDRNFERVSCRLINGEVVFNIYRPCSPEEAFTNEKRRSDYFNNNAFLENILGKEDESHRWGNVYHFKNGSISSVNDMKQGFAYLSVIFKSQKD